MSSFILELTFTGLVVLGSPVAEGVEQTAQPVQVYVLDADRADGRFRNLHSHRATLSFYAEDVVESTFALGRAGVDVHVGPDGREVVTVEIDRRLLPRALPIQLVAPSEADSFKFLWQNEEEPPRQHPVGDARQDGLRGKLNDGGTLGSMNWSPSVARMGIESLDPNSITAIIETMPFGTVGTRDLILDLQGDPIEYEFVPAHALEQELASGIPVQAEHYKQFVANQLVLHARLTEPLVVQVGSGNRLVNLEPAERGTVLRVAVTNLPHTAHNPGAAVVPTIVRHLRWFARLVPTPEFFDNIRIPVPSDRRGGFGTVQGKICPAARFHEVTMVAGERTLEKAFEP